MEISSVPVEVVDCYVLPYLDWNDLLRLRRVCKWTKGIVDAYLKVHPELAPEIEINEEERSFGEFLKMGIPTSKIYLKNTSGGDFYRNGWEDASKFLEEYGPFVKSLRVERISVLVFDKELDFLNALKNLQSFEAGRYDGYSKKLDPKDEQDDILISQIRRSKEDPRGFLKGPLEVFPKEILKQLKNLKIGNNLEDDGSLGNLYAYVEAFMSEGDNLETFALPFQPSISQGPSVSRMEAFNSCSYVQLFGVPMIYIEKRMETLSSKSFNWKVIDLVNFHGFYVGEEQTMMERLGSGVFLKLCRSCTKAGIKIMNVSSKWFSCRVVLSDISSPELGTPILSLINMDPITLSLPMPNLEKIEIRESSGSSPGRNWLQQGRPNWPLLKSLEITVNSTVGHYSEWSRELRRHVVDFTSTKELFRFFFQDVSREGLTELKLEFQIIFRNDLPVPKTELIVSSCPNLKRLTLINWKGTNKALTVLWNGLPALEEVSLEYCEDLGNVAFVGSDASSPVFLKLKKLRKLALKGLDQMPKITDTLFSLVIRHLPLTHLILTSDAPVKSITVAGLQSLCDGRFAESIQKFPFQTWELSNVSTEEFQKYEAMFRSSYFL